MVVWWQRCASAVCPQLRRVVNQTKGGKKRSMRALVVVGNKDGAAGMYVRMRWGYTYRLCELVVLFPLPLPMCLLLEGWGMDMDKQLVDTLYVRTYVCVTLSLP